MKKMVAILLTALLACSFTACRPGDSANTEPEVSAETTETEKSQEEATETETIEETAPDTNETDQTAGNGIRPEFQEAMNSYEAFFDEYVEFMESYEAADNPAGMMADYAKFLVKYTETMESMNAIDEETLSEEEAQYYAEVSLRITEKLLQISQ